MSGLAGVCGACVKGWRHVRPHSGLKNTPLLCYLFSTNLDHGFDSCSIVQLPMCFGDPCATLRYCKCLPGHGRPNIAPLFFHVHFHAGNCTCAVTFCSKHTHTHTHLLKYIMYVYICNLNSMIDHTRCNSVLACPPAHMLYRSNSHE